MLQDQLRKKAKRPPGGGDASLETVDIKDQVPNIDDVLGEVNKALKSAEKVLDQIRPVNSCTC